MSAPHPAEAAALLEHLNLHIALLDEAGQICYTNALWRRFAAENGGTDQHGVNYLSVCPPDVAQGLRDVLEGGAPRWLHEYPCHSPHERRFFRMEVTRTALAGRTYLLVAHQNITEQRLIELQVQALNAALIAHSELLRQYSFATTHTLQEPLRRLTATASGLQGMVGPDARLQRFAQINMDAAQQMSALLGSLGQYTRLGQDREDQPVRYDLRAALEREAARLRLDTVLGPLPPVLMGPRHGETLAANLLENFAQLRTPGERLTVHAGGQGEFVHLYFRLQVLPEHRASEAMKLFQTQGQAALGLSTLVTRQYGGRLWTESGGADIGLHLTLPAWRDAPGDGPGLSRRDD